MSAAPPAERSMWRGEEKPSQWKRPVANAVARLPANTPPTVAIPNFSVDPVDSMTYCSASAIGAMKAIWDVGLRVPEDIAIVGAGDIALGDLLRVPLTTVSWSREDQGKAAAELLLRRIDDELDGGEPQGPQRIVIPPRLVARRSSGVQ